MRKQDKKIQALFIIGFAITLFVVLNGYSLMSQWYNSYENGKLSYAYATYNDLEDIRAFDSDSGFEYANDSEYAEAIKTDASFLVSTLQNKDATTYLNFWLDINFLNDGGVMADVVFSCPCKWYGALSNGDLPTDEDLASGKYMVLIGESFLDYTITVNGTMYIELLGENFEVVGVLDNYQLTDEDYSLVIFYPNLEENVVLEYLEDILKSRVVTLVVGSDTGSVDACTADIIESLESAGVMKKIASGIQVYTAYATNKSYYIIKLIVIILVYIISLINCIYIALLWARHRRADYVIMRIYGLERDQITGLLMKEMAKYMGASFLVALAMELIYELIFNGRLTGVTLNMTGVYMVLIALLIMALSVYVTISVVIMRLKPSSDLRRL